MAAMQDLERISPSSTVPAIGRQIKETAVHRCLKSKANVATSQTGKMENEETGHQDLRSGSPLPGSSSTDDDDNNTVEDSCDQFVMRAVSSERKVSSMAKKCSQVGTATGQLPAAARTSDASMENLNLSKNGGTKLNVARTARGKIQIKRIENATSRQVTFSKRRNGLLKKAYELSVLCDVELALIIFSATGKLFEFASPNMKKVLERYERCLRSQQSSTNVARDLECWKHEAVQCKDNLTLTEQQLRYLAGENLGGFEVEELQRIENQLQIGVSRVRARKMQLLAEQIQNLCRRETLLLQENAMLKSKMAEAASSRQSVTTDTISQGMQESSSMKACSAKAPLALIAQGNDSNTVSVAETTLQLACPRM